MNVKNTSINTIDKYDTAKLMKRIVNDVATAISKTYGPYGANTLIQSTDTVYATKDGWTVAQNLTYPKNGIYNALKKLITDCMQAVLLNIGDGTSTVALLTASMYNKIYENIIMGKTPINVKTLENALNKIITEICDKIVKDGKPIDNSCQRDVIFNIASVATNWDMEMANFITDIYCKTNNPIIKFENSGSDKSYVEYINGYEIKGQLLLKDTYITNHTQGTCEVKNPAVIIFGHTVGEDLFETLHLMSNAFMTTEHRKLVVIAPDFQPNFVNILKSLNMQLIRQNKDVSPLILFKYYNHLNIDKDCVEDLCHLLGTETVATDNTDISDMFNDLKEAIRAKQRIDRMDNVDPEEKQMIYDHCSETLNAAQAYLSEICGQCGDIVLTDKYLLGKDFTNTRTSIIEKRKQDLAHEIEIKTKECAALSMITEGIRMKRIRLGKLQLSMGVIYVGGFGDAHLKERRDALDDATKACEAVYESGFYTIGGEIAPMVAIKSILDENSKNDESKYTELEQELLTIIYDSYFEVVRTMYNNKFVKNEEQETINSLIMSSIKYKTPYNLIKETFDDELITPVTGEVEILKGCMNLIMVMIGTNQFVFHDIQSIEDVQRIEAIEQSGDISLENAIKLNKG